MRLTRGGKALLGMLLFVAFLAPTSLGTIFIVLSCLTALLLVNFPYAWLAVRGISVRRAHPSHVKEGSELTVWLTASNRTRHARILLRLEDSGPIRGDAEQVQIPLLEPHASRTVSYGARAGKRGVHRYTLCRAESSSPFGLVRARRVLPAESEMVVYPVYYELMGAMFPFQTTYSGLTAAPGARPGEGASFFGLREYRHGDPIRKIHWPSTVRARRVMVKEFEEDTHSAVAVLVDNCRRSVVKLNGDTNLDVAARVAASLANYTIVNGHPTSLLYIDETTGCLRMDCGTGDLTPVLDGLARMTPSSAPPMDLLHASVAGTRNANWIVLLLAADRDAMSELLRVRARGIEVMAVIVDRHGRERAEAGEVWLPEMLAMFDNAGIRTVFLAPGDDVQAALSRSLRMTRRMA